MHITILSFGIARTIIGEKTIRMEVPEQATAGDLHRLLSEKYPPLGELAAFMLAVNEEYALPEVLLQEGDEVAIIPPVSGG